MNPQVRRNEIMDREDVRREGVADADDTGLIAGEERITEAETLLPLQRGFPREKLHAALPEGHAAHATIDRLHAELTRSNPNPFSIRKHVGSLRAIPEVEAAIANWWDDPKRQRVIADLGQIGL
jgi:hypothetical protein